MTLKWKLLACGLMVATSMSVQAAPTYLKCSITESDGKPFPIDVQLNEESGSVSYTFPDNGRAYTVRAIFVPSEVAFNGFFISRTDMTIKRANDDDFSRMLKKPPYSYGKCEKDKTPKAF